MGEMGLHRTITISLKRGRHGPSYPAEVQALDLSGDLSPAIKAITNGPDNVRAMELATKMGGKGFGGAVYVIGPEDGGIVKIGFAADPASRLVSLQVGNWHKLHVLALLWTDRAPGHIEHLAQKAAKEMGWHERGEWIAASTEDAAELVLKAARYAKLHSYDSGIWISNWSSRLEALAQQNGAIKRIAA